MLPSLLIFKQEEVLANRGNPLKGHPSSLDAEPPPERRVQARPVRGCGRCIGGVHGVREVLEPRRGTRNSGGPCFRKLRNSRA